MNTPVKPGYSTTEFWIALINNIVGMLLILGYITPEEADQVAVAVSQVIGGVVVIASVAIYAWSRYSLKSSIVNSGAQVGSLPIKTPRSKFVDDDPSGRLIVQ